MARQNGSDKKASLTCPITLFGSAVVLFSIPINATIFLIVTTPENFVKVDKDEIVGGLQTTELAPSHVP